MSAAWIVQVVFLVAFGLAIIAVAISRKRILRSSRGVHRLRLLNLAIVTILGGMALLEFYLEPSPRQLIPVALYGVLGLIAYFYLSTAPTESESRRQHELDPGHCGRCGYDLTGNVSGICPECGWKIADPLAQYERPEWAQWWRRWEIEYLDNWKRTHATCLLWTVIFAALAMWLLFVRGAVAFGLIPVLMALNFAINAGRARAYGRRHHRQPPR